jgi:hypothetical protein
MSACEALYPEPEKLDLIYNIAARYDISPECARQYSRGVHSSHEGEPLAEISIRSCGDSWFAAGWHDHRAGRVIVPGSSKEGRE